MKRTPGPRADREAGGRLLHNMSAPPRMQLTISPLSAQVPLLGPGPTAPPGFRLRLSLDLEQLFRHHLGDLTALKRGDKELVSLACIVQIAPRLWLALLVLLARLALNPGLRIQAADLHRLQRRNTEALGDEFITLADHTQPLALGLPSFGLAFPATGQTCATLDPALAIAVLSRLSGRVFLASASPVLPDGQLTSTAALGLFVPTGGK